MRLKYLLIALASPVATNTAVMAASSVEQAIESSAEMMTLPEKLPGAVLIRSCMQCAPAPWNTTTDTRLLIGKESVTLAKFRQFTTGKRYNIVVFYDSSSKLVTRIRVTGVTSAN